jgi:hypothetical protein
LWVGLLWFSGWGSGWSAGGLVVDVGVEGEVAEQFAGGGVDDADVAVGGEQGDAGSGVGSADADVVEPAVVAQGDVAGLVDDVVADPPVGVIGPAGGAVFGAGLVGGGGGGAFRE